MEKISFWQEFQSTNLSYDEEFKANIFQNANAGDQYMIFSSLFHDFAILIPYEEFDLMADSILDIDFFQPNDYLFLNIKNKSAVAIHHSGYIIKSQC